MLASSDEAAGHEFGTTPGVYVSPQFETARGYARSQSVFGDGLWHRVVLECQVDETQRISLRKNKKRGRTRKQVLRENSSQSDQTGNDFS